MPSIHCLCDVDTVPGFFFFPEVLGHQQIVGYHIPPFWLIKKKHFAISSISHANFEKVIFFHKDETATCGPANCHLDGSCFNHGENAWYPSPEKSSCRTRKFERGDIEGCMERSAFCFVGDSR